MEIIMSKNNSTTAENKVVVKEETISRTREITMTALFIALTYVATAFINVPSPTANGGLVHLGNVPLFVAAALYGKRTGAFAGAFGMGLFDLLSGWTAWAPFTFVICGCIGLAYGAVTYKKANKFLLVVGVFVAAVIKVAGYYVAEGIIYGNWVAPVASIPGNLVQIGVGGVIAVPCIIALQKILRRA